MNNHSSIEKRILITAVGGDLALSVIKCLKESGKEIHLVGCDMNPYAAGRAVVNDYVTAPPVKNETQYIEFMRSLIISQHIHYVFPLSDIEIEFFLRKKEFFQDLNVVVVMNDAQIIETFADKYETIQFFKANSISCPDTSLQAGYDGRLKFPVILKKRRGSGSQGLFKVDNEEELQFYLKRNRDMIIQKHIPGDEAEYTACIFSDGLSIYTITFKRRLAPGGYSNYVELVANDTISSFLQQIASALKEQMKFKGSVNVQFRISGGKCMPFEVNPRFSSTAYFRHKFGFTDVLWTLDLLEGRPIGYVPLYKRGIGVKNFGEVFFDMEQ